MFNKRIKKKLNILRSITHLKHKIFRLKDQPASISIGLAWGASVSFTPLLGLHIIICFLGTYLMKGNMLAAAAGTVVGNPWTFPFIFYMAYKIGVFFGAEGIENLQITPIFFIENFENLFFPTLIGSIPVSISVWFVTYYLSNFVIKKYKNIKRDR